jgi:hypothetical protein
VQGTVRPGAVLEHAPDDAIRARACGRHARVGT